jgi:hypothetical protein
MVVMRAAAALCAGLAVLVAVAALARAEPGPCGGTNGQGKRFLALSRPLADTRLVLTRAGAAAPDLGWQRHPAQAPRATGPRCPL